MLQQLFGHLFLTLALEEHLLAIANKGGGVIRAVKAYTCIGYVIYDDGVQAFALPFFSGVIQRVLCFCGKSHHHDLMCAGYDTGDNVWIFDQTQIQMRII